MTIIDQKLLDEVTAEAKASPRLRKNRNLHQAEEAPCHRLLNAMEPASYIMPHRHLSPHKDESLIAVRGALGVLIFDETGKVTTSFRMEPGGTAVAVDVPHGTFHTLVSLEQGSVFFECKGGPYRPLTGEEKAPWAPEEGGAEAADYLCLLLEYFS